MDRQRKRITIENQFHNSSTTVIATRNGDGEYEIPLATWRRARKRLCGRTGCECAFKDRAFADGRPVALIAC